MANAAIDTAYIGTELELFATAHRWKRYFASRLRRYIGGAVAEIGAGLGGTTTFLCTGGERDWLCVEPDQRLAAEIVARIHHRQLPDICRVHAGFLRDLDEAYRFDTILYIDVIEHIENDAAELATAMRFLAPGGRLIVLAPAFQWLLSPFDAAIGHHRRYDRSRLYALTPTGLSVAACFYLDSVGVLASAANRILLRSAMPTPRQIALWDRAMIFFSRLLDPLIGFQFGKSVAVIWAKKTDA